MSKLNWSRRHGDKSKDTVDSSSWSRPLYTKASPVVTKCIYCQKEKKVNQRCQCRVHNLPGVGEDYD